MPTVEIVRSQLSVFIEPMTRRRRLHVLAAVSLTFYGYLTCCHGQPVVSAEREMIVAAFGTSLTHRAGWLEPLEMQLTRCVGRPARVLDFGRNGATSKWGLEVVEEVIRSQPDIVLVEFATNDAAFFKGLSLQGSRENTGGIVRAIKKKRPKAAIFLMAMNPSFGPRGWLRFRLDTYYDMYRSVANETGVGYIDHRQDWKKLTEDQIRGSIPDGVHPLPEVAARILVPTISKAIGGVACGETQN